MIHMYQTKCHSSQHNLKNVHSYSPIPQNMSSFSCETSHRVLYASFWVIPRCLNFICRCFGTLCLFHLHRRIGVELRILESSGIKRHGISKDHTAFTFRATYPPMKTEQTQCSETSAYKIQTPGNYPEESVQHSEQGESLKSRTVTGYLKISSHKSSIYISPIRETMFPSSSTFG